MRWSTRCSLALLALTTFACSDEPEAQCPERPGVICTWVGDGRAAFNGDDKPLAESSLYWPIDVTFDPDGHTYVVDWNNHRVREVTPEETLRTVLGTGFVGDGPDDQSDLTPQGALGTDIHLNHPTQMVPVPDGMPILVSWHNHKLRRYDPATGYATVTCGRGAGFAGDGGPASTALLDQPNQMAVAQDRTQYILDQRNQVIRRIDSDGIITTAAGTLKSAGFSGDGASPLSAQFNFPTGSNPPPGGGLALDEAGNLYVSDTLNHRIRKVDFGANVITTVAGTGIAGYSGDGGPATNAQLNNPRKLTIGPDRRLYVGDEYNHRIRAIDLTTGTIETVAGNGEKGYAGDGGLATECALNQPAGVAFDGLGNMYVIDTDNNRIRKVVR